MKLLCRLLLLAAASFGAYTVGLSQDPNNMREIFNGFEAEFKELEAEYSAFQKKSELEKKRDKDNYVKQARATLSRLEGRASKLKEAAMQLKGQPEFNESNSQGNFLREAESLNQHVKSLRTYFGSKPSDTPRISDGLGALGSKINSSLTNIKTTLTQPSAQPSSSPPPTPTPTVPERVTALEQRVENLGRTQGAVPWLWLAPGIGLSVLLTVLATWWLKQRIDLAEYGTGKRLAQAAQRQQELAAYTNDLSATVNGYSGNLSALSAAVNTLRAEVAELRARVQQGGDTPVITRPRVEEPPPKPEPPRAVSVADYLRRVAGSSHRAKPAPLRPNILNKATNDDGPYVVAPNGGSGLFEVAPGYPRFTSSQDFMHYQGFYDCDQPASGEVFIVEPALAAYDAALNQYQLRKKGRLQIG
jgi:Skp family chaperone for outer membrane proteins